MSKIQMGESLKIDLQRLVETRLLIQANSGGGKSYAIRKLLEETHGKIQQIVLDVEGEFASLRTKFDYVLAGQGGDIPTDPRSAELLARKLLELQADCIIDLYELKPKDRSRYVKLFLESIISAPKDQWHPVLILIDEAQLFCPEKGEGESEASGAVIDLCTRGRKREFVAVLATLRISAVRKDALAQCLNKLIGRTGLDIDMKRAAYELGFTTSEQRISLRNLDPGEFYAFGPAISKEVIQTKIGEVQTPHGQAARKALAHKPTATTKVKHILGKLTDLPKEAEEELRDRQALQTKVKELEREIKKKPHPEADQAMLKREFEKGQAQAVRKLQQMIKINASVVPKLEQVISTLKAVDTDVPHTVSIASPPSRAPIQRRHVQRQVQETDTEGRTFGQCERRILGFLDMKRGEMFSKSQVGAMTGYSHGSGGFNNALSNLHKAGLIVRQGSQIAIDPSANGAVAEIVGDEIPHRLEDWIAKLGACERAVYQELLTDPRRLYNKAEIAEITGYSAGSGGFNNALSRLNTLGLIKRHHDGTVSINDEIVGIT